ncbi:MAG: hypothetical protein BWY46_00271 [Firmicutes bacterium ADurb.Bin300]|jgi:uncharacterized alkaline shock family protein YloU|nr:MAG: hypothetical protein BWY46_00271 [Firmicutes bacterium ADurb.Bin300]HOD02013.1 Asp23/Gls24 family envelope stress response protein [Clostridiales bacterium]
MVKIENHLGIVEISKEYFSSLIGNAASSCFGVAGMANSNAKQNIRSFFFRTRQYIDQGVNVLKDADGLIIELHIIISFGLNISAIVKSIVNKVRYTVEEATGLEVKKVNVFVDSMI